ncbi:MAG: hypothetical protein ISS47_00770 [Candidatus Omnitrophica bacterium]|nr:hypothetical protein [Candidatus Omnitrophota bacterium]
MINIILTVDYEIFGDGTGDVKDDLCRPMEELRVLSNQFGIKLTVFFDICEYWAFKKAEEQNLLNHLGYSPVRLIENQVKQLVNDGHDIQLHVHPQWLGAYYEEKRWHLNFEKFRVADLPYEELKNLLSRAKHDLEALIKPFNPHYECIAFRAGSFSVQPSKELIKALQETDFLFDSSVAKGFTRFDKPFMVDFREAFSEFKPWWVEDDILKSVAPEKAKIMEIPIYCKIMKRFLRFLKVKIERNIGVRKDTQRMYPKDYSLGSVLSWREKISIKYLKYLLGDMAVMWDFCELSGSELIALLKDALRKKNKEDIEYLPLIMIGHPKLLDNCRNLEKLFQYVCDYSINNGHVRFGTFYDIKEQVIEKK